MSNPNDGDWGTASGEPSEKIKELEKQAEATKPKKGKKGKGKKGKKKASDGFTDARMAERVAKDVMDGHYMWTPGQHWFAYSGKVWERVPEPTVIEAVRQYAIDGYREADSELERDGWKSMLSRARLSSVTALAKGIVTVKDEDLDYDPDLLNTPSGVIDLRTGELSEHEPEDLMTKMTRAEYRQDAHSPDWKTALDALPPEVAEYLQLRVGQALSGNMTPDDVLPICQGGGENGKTTFFEGITRALGSYFVLVSDRVILANPGDHPTELTDLMGARLALIEETPEARRLSVSRLKKVLGSPNITARRTHKDNMTWRSSHSLFVTTNYHPVVEETDHGTWRRLQLIRFPYKFTRNPKGANERAGDASLRARVSRDPAVWAAALLWAIEGAVRLAEMDGVLPDPPKVVRVDTEEWRGATDVILAFANERLQPNPKAFVLACELLAEFNAWNGEASHDWSERTFASRFKGHDYYAQNAIVHTRERTDGEGVSRSRLKGVADFPLPSRARCYRGVEFRRGSDLGE